jgi:hypothetical protein
MPKQICEISAAGWFYYKEIYYDERKKNTTLQDTEGQYQLHISWLGKI